MSDAATQREMGAATQREMSNSFRVAVIAMITLSVFLTFTLVFIFLTQFKALRSYSSSTPMAIDTIAQSSDAENGALARVRAFFGPGMPDTLRISEIDFNHLIRTCRLLEDMRLDYRIHFRDSSMVARSSVPLSQVKGAYGGIFKYLKLEGYVNSEVEGFPRLDGGKIVFIPQVARMNGREAPLPIILKRGGNIDPRELILDKYFYDAAIGQLAEVRIRGGELFLIKKH